MVCEAAAVADRASGPPERPLDKPALTATPSELLAVARAAPAGDGPVTMLRQRRDISFDDAGRATTRAHTVFVVRAQDELLGWETIDATWSPWYQDRPVLRARVIDPSGSVTLLDPALIVELPPSRRSTAATETRLLQAKLPHLQIGCVVEHEIVTTDREPRFATGSVDVEELRSYRGVASFVVSFSAPAARKVHHVERKLPAGVRASHAIANGRETWVYAISGLAGTNDMEQSVPGDVVQVPYVGVATAPSWAAVALGYRKLVDQRIAEGPVALPAELPRTPSIETVNAISSWLHRQVHDKELELGESSAIPSTPAETVKSGLGDDRDRATLLVALLRQAGVRADLAVLSNGSSADLDPDLPGLPGYGHTIVRARVDGRDLWIEPTEPLMRPGQLTSRHQGRRTLVIAEDTKGLIATPTARPADNVIREVRTFVAAEAGASQLTEVLHHTGVFEARERARVRYASARGHHTQYDEYVESEYGGTLISETSTSVEDLTTPFAVTRAVKDALRVYTHREQIEVALYPSATLVALPSIIRNTRTAPRTCDFVWEIPQVYEIENRIVVPTGFTLPLPAPARTRAIATAQLTETQRIDGQTLIVTFRFDSGKLRLTAAELDKLQDAVHELRDEVVHLNIDHAGFALSYAGKPREAIAEVERLIALHPTEAVHHEQLSAVLLHAGAGEAARREARKAVALAPSDADPLVVLGWTLTFDTVGRRYGFDWDRAGALAAFHKARKLNPRHLGAATHIADVAARNAFGRQFDDGADLRTALDAARAALALEKTDEHALSVVRLLVMVGEYDDAETLARTMSSATRDTWLVAATAASRGAAAASQSAGSLRSGSDRTKLIDETAQILVRLRRYELANALIAETGTLAHRAAPSAAMMQKVTRHDAIKAGSKDPRDAALEAMLATADVDHVTHVFWNADVEQQYRRTTAQTAPLRNLTTSGVLSDLVQSNVQLSVEGDGDAWRVEGTVGTQRMQIYVALDHGSAKVFGGPDAPAGVGAHVLRLLDSKRDGVARRVLDWLVKDVHPGTGVAANLHRVWGPGFPTDRDQIALAAGDLVANVAPERAIAITMRCTSTIADVELLCKQLLIGAYAATHRWADVENQVAIAKDRGAGTTWGRGWHVRALAYLGRFDDADRVLDDALGKNPDDRDAMALRIVVASARGQPGEAVKRGDALASRAAATADDLNLAAWTRLTEGADLDVAIDLARRALERRGDAYPVLNTLAAIEAERGELGLAMQDNWKAMGADAARPPRPADWYVTGRVLEQLGLVDDAVAAYKRIPRSVDLGGSVSELAARRLGALAAAH
jgi:tetratricopeptide (TPR) repeat protein